MAGQNILEYIEGLEGQTLPPLLLEVLLKSGRTFYIKNAFRPDSEQEMVVLRVWDLRATDVSSLPEKLNSVVDRDGWEDFEAIDGTLDQANLWVHIGEIEGFVEWHERFWPTAPAETARPQVGFFQPGGEASGPAAKVLPNPA